MAVAHISDLPTAQLSIFTPAGTPSHFVYTLSLLVLSITLAIFLVAGLLLFALIKYRHRPADPKAIQELAQIYGSNQIKLSWTVIPILVTYPLIITMKNSVEEVGRKEGSDAVAMIVVPRAIDQDAYSRRDLGILLGAIKMVVHRVEDALTSG